jgi:hypothetical protein
MSNTRFLSAGLEKAAERELKAFRQAVAEGFPSQDLDNASSIWLQGMESLEWKADLTAERFLRKVTIQAVAQLSALCA